MTALAARLVLVPAPEQQVIESSRLGKLVDRLGGTNDAELPLQVATNLFRRPLLLELFFESNLPTQQA